MSTIMAAGFVIAVAIIIIAVLRSLLTGGRTMRRGSGNPGIPYGGSSGPSAGGGWDGGSSGGDGGGGDCGGGGGGGG
ncbi:MULTISPECIES: hypothetical protein [unclassified Nonomuraea]|uniref:hypothetical protein n=1 Tax=unclassified Nonomuraea TaxID=2593643 RepID=UPI0035BFB588